MRPETALVVKKIIEEHFDNICADFNVPPDQEAYRNQLLDHIPGGYSYTYALRINDAGEILGYSGNPPTEQRFILSNGAYTTVNQPGAFGMILYGKNAHNQIVGAWKDNNSNFHGFVYNGKTFTSVEPSGAVPSWAKGINRRYQIVGKYIGPDNNSPGFLATPIDALPAIQLLLVE